ncbi:dTDP-4-dehydrorhamnose 3,5-epimerase family protein [Paracraurococcus lichenis]|uniref:dTDP-4-dehydrorhamnose 3,5-epimerase n=1 Tax=Paracraurococcus lichenis TaxID=3064888 RepID=A0ABT9DSY0_9PROT|nr:dTDP-4-dehydrorhamnose 3,5-epimerase family protein [Paracraurococcus sp. LOR1-02]MDO9706983.1 dTDP-4-dehydrorhamnose 3,5-epimerase family protein [Paracraurococcus sp. LOR1-02]
MILRPTAIAGVVEVLAEPVADARGRFIRTWCADEFAAAGLDFRPHQVSISENRARHTLRGLHFQVAPAEERKLIRCLRGAVFDVAVDLRPDSPSYRCWVGVELTAAQHNALFVPHGCAHGFLSLTEDAWLEYLIDAPYRPGTARGLRWNDPAFGIAWPAAPAVISDRDRDWPDHG